MNHALSRHNSIGNPFAIFLTRMGLTSVKYGCSPILQKYKINNNKYNTYRKIKDR